jgi:hypothetical protein
MKQYLIKGGNTYSIKEDLKAHACSWDSKNKAWKTPPLDKDEVSYKMIKSLCDCVDSNMIPLDLTEDEKRIQEIINGIKF